MEEEDDEDGVVYAAAAVSADDEEAADETSEGVDVSADDVSADDVDGAVVDGVMLGAGHNSPAMASAFTRSAGAHALDAHAWSSDRYEALAHKHVVSVMAQVVLFEDDKAHVKTHGGSSAMLRAPKTGATAAAMVMAMIEPFMLIE